MHLPFEEGKYLPFKVDANLNLICPVCGDCMVHPVAVECRSPGQANGHVTIDENGIAIDPKAPPIESGVTIWLKFKCENGDFFEYGFHFSHGSTYVSGISGTVIYDENERPSHDTIWRD